MLHDKIHIQLQLNGSSGLKIQWGVDTISTEVAEHIEQWKNGL